jgi:membrane glycosyltransferase
MSTASHVAVATAAFCQAMLCGASTMERIVFVPNWRDPAGLVAYRALLRHRHPGHFYQVLAPLTLLVLVVALVLSLLAHTGAALVGISLAAILTTEIFTFVYFFPRNRRLFFTPEEQTPGEVSRQLGDEWARATLLRIALLALGAATSLAAL